METEPYPFVEWPLDRCIDRQDELVVLDKIPHGTERARSIGRELLHLTQEIDWKHEERNNGQIL